MAKPKQLDSLTSLKDELYADLKSQGPNILKSYDVYPGEKLIRVHVEARRGEAPDLRLSREDPLPTSLKVIVEFAGEVYDEVPLNAGELLGTSSLVEIPEGEGFLGIQDKFSEVHGRIRKIHGRNSYEAYIPFAPKGAYYAEAEAVERLVRALEIKVTKRASDYALILNGIAGL